MINVLTDNFSFFFAYISLSHVGNPTKSPIPYDRYPQVHSREDGDCHAAYTVMVGDPKYCNISVDKDLLEHAMVPLLAFFYVYHFEYSQPLCNT